MHNTKVIPDDLFRALLARLLAFPKGTSPLVGELCYRLAMQWCSLCKIEPVTVMLALAETKDELLQCAEQVCKDPQKVRMVSILNNRFLTYGGDKAYDTIIKAWIPVSQVLPATTVVLSFNLSAHWHDIQHQHQIVRSRHSDTNQQSVGGKV